jgi:hypothetical protein
MGMKASPVLISDPVSVPPGDVVLPKMVVVVGGMGQT